jgi:hypothetical protein
MTEHNPDIKMIPVEKRKTPNFKQSPETGDFHWFSELTYL